MQAALIKGHHLSIQLGRAHLPVGNADLCFRNIPAQPISNAADALYMVMQIIDLPAAVELAPDRLIGKMRIKAAYHGADCFTLSWWRADNGDRAQTGKRLVQGSWNRRGGQGQQVHVGVQRFKLLLVLHTKSLLLIDNDKAEIGKLELVGEQTVCAYNNTGFTTAQLTGNAIRLLLALQPRYQLHLQTAASEALGEAVVVLIGQHRGRDKNGYLTT